MKNTFKLSENLIEKINDIDFSVKEYDDEFYFSKYSPAGQDFNFSIDKTEIETIEDLADAVYKYYRDYDCSEETYVWLDKTGHGTNGAPYNMKDVYEDMEACETYIYELYKLLKEENKKTEILIEKWYEDCLFYNIPVSPSDVKDIVEELIKLKKEKEEA